MRVPSMTTPKKTPSLIGYYPAHVEPKDATCSSILLLLCPVDIGLGVERTDTSFTSVPSWDRSLFLLRWTMEQLDVGLEAIEANTKTKMMGS